MSTKKLEKIWRVGRFAKVELDAKESKLRSELEGLAHDAAANLARVNDRQVQIPELLPMGARAERIAGLFASTMALRALVAELEGELGRSLTDGLSLPGPECKACATRRAHGFEGLCPACAHERARGEKP